MNTACLK